MEAQAHVAEEPGVHKSAAERAKERAAAIQAAIAAVEAEREGLGLKVPMFIKHLEKVAAAANKAARAATATGGEGGEGDEDKGVA